MSLNIYIMTKIFADIYIHLVPKTEQHMEYCHIYYGQ